MLQTLGLLSKNLDPGEVARFLRHCPGLSKQTIGDLLGENDQFFLDVLDNFTATFNFKGAWSQECACIMLLVMIEAPADLLCLQTARRTFLPRISHPDMKFLLSMLEALLAPCTQLMPVSLMPIM